MLNPLSWPTRILMLIGVVVVAAVALVVVYFVVIRDDAPPPVSIESAVESVEADQQEDQEAAASSASSTQDSGESSASSASSEDDGSDETAVDYGETDSQEDAEETVSVSREDLEADDAQDSEEAEEPAAPLSLADLAGTWVLAETGESFVGYRIGETFADIGTATAVGRTSDLTAELDFDGTAITRVQIVADLRNLRSDQSRRDQTLRTRGLETDTYPYATFSLAQPIAIGALPGPERALQATASGTLELHGVTNDVQIELSGQLAGEFVVVVGSAEIALADYEIDPPTNFRVLSIEETGVMEFQIVFARQ